MSLILDIHYQYRLNRNVELKCFQKYHEMEPVEIGTAPSRERPGKTELQVKRWKRRTPIIMAHMRRIETDPIHM